MKRDATKILHLFDSTWTNFLLWLSQTNAAGQDCSSPLSISLLGNKMSETEQPFRPRETLVQKQKFFQNIHRHTYLKGPMDKLTSVAIPLALAASSLYFIGRGIYNMSHGIGKKE